MCRGLVGETKDDYKRATTSIHSLKQNALQIPRSMVPKNHFNHPREVLPHLPDNPSHSSATERFSHQCAPARGMQFRASSPAASLPRQALSPEHEFVFRRLTPIVLINPQPGNNLRAPARTGLTGVERKLKRAAFVIATHNEIFVDENAPGIYSDASVTEHGTGIAAHAPAFD